MRKNTNHRKKSLKKLFEDPKIQLFIGKLLSGEILNLFPVFDPQLGYRYPELELYITDPKKVELLLLKLVETGILTCDLCGVLLFCKKCSSFHIKKDISNNDFLERSTERPLQSSILYKKASKVVDETIKDENLWFCEDCGTHFVAEELDLNYLYSFRLNETQIKLVSKNLIVLPVMDFLKKRGYKINSPGTILGQSEVEHSFDILAYQKESGEYLAIDFLFSSKNQEEKRVLEMFAKVFDCSPLKLVLIVFPNLNENARKLAKKFKLNVIETDSVTSIPKQLMNITSSVKIEELKSLDVMTLLSLPDHLRKSASVLCEIDSASAEEVSRKTERTRAVESNYLNQLVRMGFLKKERLGRKVFFSIESTS